jgi:hypothetical protein
MLSATYGVDGESQGSNAPVSSISCLINASRSTKLNPLASKIFSSEMVSSSTSWLGQTALIAATKLVSLMRSCQIG